MEKERIKCPSETVGIVFPVYNHRIPFILKRFVQKLSLGDGVYLFGVCTYGENPCLALERLDRKLRKR